MEAIPSQETVPAPPLPWIDARDRVPQPYRDVLLIRPNGQWGTGYWDVKEQWVFRGKDRTIGFASRQEFSHWLDVTPPTEDEQAREGI